MEELKEWLINEINSICKDYHNESTYMWSKGYKKSCLEVLDKIKKIENEKSNTKKEELDELNADYLKHYPKRSKSKMVWMQLLYKSRQN